MASGSSQAAYLTPTPLRKHDVFLSFYGSDTRKGFSDHLYKALKDKDIFVYRDDEELKRGENISALLKAIQESEYAVVVISENYAFSKWCLKELTEIVKCKTKYRLMILPVFYHVDPSDVRNQKESFAEGLAMHVKESEEDRMKWRSALKEVSNIAGWHVHNSYESTIVQEICREIFIGLNCRLLNNFKDIVGIESQVKEMMTLLRARANDVHFIGICGMGGIGKTTLAQVIFDNISSEFEATCFVEDVREKHEKNDIVHLQKQIIDEILGDKDTRIWNSFGGTRLIANRLKDKKIFLVLDNVDEASQIEALAGSPNWFGQESIVLLTSRDKQLLEGFVDEIYEVKGLSDNDALRLFCLKAFKKNDPIENFETLSREFVYYAQGLPLALKVFGSLLLKKELPIWESTLKQLKEEPNMKILDKLKISFDGLSNSQQELFLEIACFFNGKPINDNVMQYLVSVGYHPKSNIEVLKDRSLINVSYGIFKMHNLLQDMGRQVVCEKSWKNPGERSRLWCNEDIIQVLKNKTGTDAVEGIFLKLPLSKSIKLSFEGFSKMKRLKLLVIRPICSYHQCDECGYKCNHEAFEHIRTVEWFGNFSKFMLSNELRILEWWGYPLEWLPTNFEPANLIKLKMPMSNIKQLWNGKKDFEKLKDINLSDSQNLVEMPDFSQVPNLEKLNIKGTGIRQLLTIVLPEKLNELNVGGSFSKPISLVLHGFSLNLKFLGKLNLSYCNLTEETLPNDFGCLSSLRDLDLSGNKFTRIDCVSKLSNLRQLFLSNCEKLKALPPKFSSRLSVIKPQNCPSSTTISDPRDTLTSSEALVASNMTFQAIYFGYDGQRYYSPHLGQSYMENSFAGRKVDGFSAFYTTVTWGPTLTSDMPRWFTGLPDISGMFQRQFEVKSRQSPETTDTNLYYSPGEYGNICSWGYALFIVYEVPEHDSCQMKGEIHEGDENGNFSSTIFPVFVCELEVHKINDRKVPMGWGRQRSYEKWKSMGKYPDSYEKYLAEEWRSFEKVPREYGRTLGKVPIVLRVPNIPSVGRNGVWVFIGAECFEELGLSWCDDLGLCSISVSSLNVEVKECGGRLVLKNDLSECYEIIKSISPHDLDPETLRKAFNYQSTNDLLCISGARIIGKRGKKKKREKNCPSLTSSEILMARDISEFEAFYFGNDGKRCRTYHFAQSIINDLQEESLYLRYKWDRDHPQPRHFATVTWGPTVTSDILEWFTCLPNISGIFQRCFETEAQRGFLPLSCEPASWYHDAVEKKLFALKVSSWGYALFIVYEIFESDSCQRKGEMHEVEVDEFGNSSSTIFPEFVCELEFFTTSRTPVKVPIAFRVPDIPSVGRNGVWVFINGNCFRNAGLECWNDVGLCSVSISSPNVDIKECGDRLVLKNDGSECYEIIKSISPHDLDSETLQDAFYEGGFGVFGDMMPGQKRKERKEQKGVGIYEEGEREGVEIWEEREEEGVEFSEEGEEEGIDIFEEGEEEKGKICEEGEKEGIDIFEEGEEEGVEICEKGEEVSKERKRRKVGVEICEEGKQVLKERKRKRKKVGVEICEKGEEVLKESKRKVVLKFMKKGKRKGKKVQKSVTKGKRNVLKSVKEGKRKKMLKFAAFPIYRSFFLFYKLVKSKSEFSTNGS